MSGDVTRGIKHGRKMPRTCVADGPERLLSTIYSGFNVAVVELLTRYKQVLCCMEPGCQQARMVL